MEEGTGLVCQHGCNEFVRALVFKNGKRLVQRTHVQLLMNDVTWSRGDPRVISLIMKKAREVRIHPNPLVATTVKHDLNFSSGGE